VLDADCSFREECLPETLMNGLSKAADSIAQVSISRTLIDTRARPSFSLNSNGEGAALHFDIEAGG
jgi:hypothetical protein